MITSISGFSALGIELKGVILGSQIVDTAPNTCTKSL